MGQQLITGGSGQGVFLYAEDTTSNAPKTGDAANISGFWSKDGGAETAGFTTAHPTEIGHGVYWQPLTATETNGTQLSYAWASTTSGVRIDPTFITTAAAVVTPPTTAQIATAVWQDATAGDFNVASSIGKALYTGPPSWFSSSTPPTAGQIAAAVWDEVNTAATHNITNSAGKQLRSINPVTDTIRTATCPAQTGMTSTQIKLDAGASAVDNTYNYDVVSITAGTGAGQSRIVTSYSGSTKVCSIDNAWTTPPNNTSTFEITPTASTRVVSYLAGQDPGSLVLATPANKLATDASGNVALSAPPGVRRNVALPGFEFPMYDASNANNLKSGLTVSVVVSLDGGAFVATANNPAEVGSNGVYALNLAAADLNGGVCTFKATATGALTQTWTVVTQP
jgi:hypothetical protein